MEMMNYFLAFICSLGSVFLKGIQHRNIACNMFKATFVVSYLMAFVDVFLVGLVVRSDWTIAVASGGGAAIGMVSAMHFHDRLSRWLAKRAEGAVAPDGT